MSSYHGPMNIVRYWVISRTSKLSKRKHIYKYTHSNLNTIFFYFEQNLFLHDKPTNVDEYDNIESFHAVLFPK